MLISFHTYVSSLLIFCTRIILSMGDFLYEDAMGGIVAGVDEVGRGALAGPVISCAVVIYDRNMDLLLDVRDSKKLSNKRRIVIAEKIMQCAYYGIGRAEVIEIESMNILEATKLSMIRAVQALNIKIDGILVDGKEPISYPAKCECIIGGDDKSISIGAASIIAKVHRDTEMSNLAKQFLCYGWDKNKGYGTAEHINCLKKYGYTVHHRRNFAPISDMI